MNHLQLHCVLKKKTPSLQMLNKKAKKSNIKKNLIKKKKTEKKKIVI